MRKSSFVLYASLCLFYMQFQACFIRKSRLALYTSLGLFHTQVQPVSYSSLGLFHTQAQSCSYSSQGLFHTQVQVHTLRSLLVSLKDVNIQSCIRRAPKFNRDTEESGSNRPCLAIHYTCLCATGESGRLLLLVFTFWC